MNAASRRAIAVTNARSFLAAVLVASTAGLASTAAASAPQSALPNREQIRFTPADQAAARAVVLCRADLGPTG
jgi:hypothetical protein